MPQGFVRQACVFLFFASVMKTLTLWSDCRNTRLGVVYGGYASGNSQPSEPTPHTLSFIYLPSVLWQLAVFPIMESGGREGLLSPALCLLLPSYCISHYLLVVSGSPSAETWRVTCPTHSIRLAWMTSLRVSDCAGCQPHIHVVINSLCGALITFTQPVSNRAKVDIRRNVMQPFE